MVQPEDNWSLIQAHLQISHFVVMVWQNSFHWTFREFSVSIQLFYRPIDREFMLLFAMTLISFISVKTRLQKKRFTEDEITRSFFCGELRKSTSADHMWNNGMAGFRLFNEVNDPKYLDSCENLYIYKTIRSNTTGYRILQLTNILVLFYRIIFIHKISGNVCVIKRKNVLIFALE